MCFKFTLIVNEGKLFYLQKVILTCRITFTQTVLKKSESKMYCVAHRSRNFIYDNNKVLKCMKSNHQDVKKMIKPSLSLLKHLITAQDRVLHHF